MKQLKKWLDTVTIGDRATFYFAFVLVNRIKRHCLDIIARRKSTVAFLPWNKGD
jgi:hypothetical protein